MKAHVSEHMIDKENWKCARKKPVIIHFREPVEEKELILSLEGWQQAIRGIHFVVCGVKGELYVIRKDIFAETYEVFDSQEEKAKTT
jgi:hypothetical protein